MRYNDAGEGCCYERIYGTYVDENSLHDGGDGGRLLMLRPVDEEDLDAVAMRRMRRLVSVGFAEVRSKKGGQEEIFCLQQNACQLRLYQSFHISKEGPILIEA